jgi:hypothetical protein
MIQTSVKQNGNSILILPLPEQYWDADIEVLIYSKAELAVLPTQQRKPVTMGDFIGTMNREDAEQLRRHVENARGEWDRDF